MKNKEVLEAEERSILLRQCEDGTWEEKPEPYAVIECETEEDFSRIKQSLEATRWIPVEERLPEDDDYILLSFENFSLPAIGRYEESFKGGAFYLGDEETSYVLNGLFVNAWLPLLKPYRPERAEN